VLAEGSKLVLVATQSAAEQGVYGLASNLGSLVVRTVFQPFEEAAFLAFARPGGGGGGGGGGSGGGGGGTVRSLRCVTFIVCSSGRLPVCHVCAVAFQYHPLHEAVSEAPHSVQCRCATANVCSAAAVRAQAAP
jgi:hypothetical protein